MSPGVELAQQVAVLSAAPALLSVTASFCPVPSVLWALISLESISSVFLAHFSHLSIFYSFLRGLQQGGKLAGEAEMLPQGLLQQCYAKSAPLVEKEGKGCVE